MSVERTRGRHVSVTKAAIILGLVLFTLRGSVTALSGTVVLCFAAAVLMVVCGWRLAVGIPVAVAVSSVLVAIFGSEANEPLEAALSVAAVITLVATLAGVARSLDDELSDRWRRVIPLMIGAAAVAGGIGYLARGGMESWPTWVAVIFWAAASAVVAFSVGVSLVALQLASRTLDRLSVPRSTVSTS